VCVCVCVCVCRYIAVRSSVRNSTLGSVLCTFKTLDLTSFSDMKKADFVECIQKCHDYFQNNTDVSSVLVACTPFNKYIPKLLTTKNRGRNWFGSAAAEPNQFRPDPARKLSANLYDVYHCCVYSEKLLMMDRGTVRNM